MSNVSPSMGVKSPISGKTARETVTVALAGNPNSGKTTIFNNLTGSNQHVGNYAGVTVETKEGSFRYQHYQVKVVDLPGTYSLNAYSQEEIVARNYLIDHQPDVVVNIVDGSNLERNLYLALQIKELGVPLVMALNMADEIKKQGLHVDSEILSRELGAAIVPTIGTRNKGTSELMREIIAVARGDGPRPQGAISHYSAEIESELQKIAQPIEEYIGRDLREATDIHRDLCRKTSPRWVALKLLENDTEILSKLGDCETRRVVAEQVEVSRKRLSSLFGEDPEEIIAEQRYGYAHGIFHAAVRRSLSQKRINFSDQLDKVLTNRVLGLPIFAVLMYLTFWMVFAVGEYPMQWIERGQQLLVEGIGGIWPAGRVEMFRSLLLDGIIAGVGGVMVFLPNIMLLFLALSLLEDTGYMARTAFLMDRLMKWVGLHGKSFIPMLTGFGCSVPAIMSTRVLDNRRDRITTILVLPFMSCGARLPIYMLFIPAFFPTERAAATVLYSMYIIGIVVAILCARLLRSTVFRGAPSPFVMEMPPYRLPTLKAMLLHMWQRSWLYLKKAGTIILTISVLLWGLSNFPRRPAEQLAGLSQAQAAEQSLRYSVAGRIGAVIEPVLRPMGFDWKIGTALIGALAAKEVFVSQMGIVYALGEIDEEEPAAISEAAGDEGIGSRGEKSNAERLREKLRADYTPLVGFCVMLFCLLTAPCMATIAVTRKETGSWLWPMLQLSGMAAIAYVVTTVVYQLGVVLQLGS